MNSTEGTSARVTGNLSFHDEVLTVFQESRGLIRAAFLQEYQMGESEAKKLEADLLEWFSRFCLRPGAPDVRSGRDTLLIMACVFARSQQKALFQNSEFLPNDKLAQVLERDPVSIARDISRRLKFLYRGLHSA